jgi:hypothetical protein
MKVGLPTYKSAIDRKAAAASMAFMVTHKLLEQPLDIARLIHDKAP